MLRFSRRTALRFAAGFAAALAMPAGIGRALARSGAKEAIAAFTNGRTPAAGRIELDLPFTADNANAVPVDIQVDSPMTADSYCEEVLLIAEKNPRPVVCTFRFSPGLVVPQVATRIRLGESQNVTVLAKMNDGSVFMASKAIVVTIGGCGG